MSQYGIKRDKYDITFAKFIKLRDGGICQKCIKRNGTETSHIFSRRHQGTRCDPENAYLSCNYCHREYHANPIASAEWLKAIIGQARYDRLRLKANTPTKLTTWDKDEIRKIHMENIKKLEAGEKFKPFNSKT